VSYGGTPYDPATGENKLSYNVLKASVEELRYAYDPQAEFANTVRVLVRESTAI